MDESSLAVLDRQGLLSLAKSLGILLNEHEMLDEEGLRTLIRRQSLS